MPSWGLSSAPSPWLRQEFRQSDQVVGRCCKGEGPSDLLDPPVLCLPEASDRLHPAEAFFNPLADAQARGIAGMPRRAAIDSGPAAGVASDVRGDVDLAQLHHEVRRIVALVATKRDGVGPV